MQQMCREMKQRRVGGRNDRKIHKSGVRESQLERAVAKLERLFGHFCKLKALINRQLFGQFWSGSVCQSANKQFLFALVYSWVPDTKSHPCHARYCQCFSQKGDITQTRGYFKNKCCTSALLVQCLVNHKTQLVCCSILHAAHQVLMKKLQGCNNICS